ncbi:RICIN domain-containing protein [Kitasatospora sp. NPDC001603]|uniref:RICIN domain-containing protein n=1 Tax=Kitasatospora sp. NPDC001603 TaxID=3154388 RepID=UPI003333D316
MNSLKRHLGSAAAALLLGAAGTVGIAAPASATTAYRPVNSTGDVEIRATFSDKCLEVADWRTDDGAPVRQWTCTGGDNQKWRFTDGYAVNVHSGKCLEVPGWSTTPAAPIGQWTCTGGNNQRWGAVDVGNGGLGVSDRSMAVVNFHSDLVLDVNGGDFADGAPVIQWYSTGVRNQRLLLTPPATAAR